MNSSQTRLPLWLGTCVLTLAAGFALGRFSRPTAPAGPRHPMREIALEAHATRRDIRTADAPADSHEWAALQRALAARPPSPATDQAIAASLEKLAEQDPSRALACALGERNRRRRTQWLHEVLHGWGTNHPAAAAAWVTTLPFSEQEEAEAAVMEGAVQNPGAATALAQTLVQNDPPAARSHAGQLLRALSETGHYELAIDFADGLPEQIRSEMLGTAFQYWALSQPERALDAALALPAGDQRTTALDAALSGWSQGDPSSLAEFALRLPSTADRTEALGTALREWVQSNVKEASDWIDGFDPKPELDAGAAAVALQPDLVSSRPEIAAGWAESITDSKLRTSTLTAVLRQWAEKNPADALAYARRVEIPIPDSGW